MQYISTLLLTTGWQHTLYVIVGTVQEAHIRVGSALLNLLLFKLYYAISFLQLGLIKHNA